ncbi:MAG: FGGY-family carbohydrate kinase [Thermodesulfobacteriota bacterium]
MTEPLFLAIDHGTSGVRAALVSGEGAVRGYAVRTTPIHFLPGGGAEQNPEDWWQALCACVSELAQKDLIPPSGVTALCVSSTFSTTVAVDEQGSALAPAMTWMDGRGGKHVKNALRGFPSVMGYGLLPMMSWIKITGGGPSLSGKDDIGHVLFWKNEQPELYQKAAFFLPSKDYLNARLTGKIAASIDSMTLFWISDTRNISQVRYDPGLIARLGIAPEKLPPMHPSTHVLGTLCEKAARDLSLSPDTPVVCGSPDHQAAGVGSFAVNDFAAHLYIGTSSWVQCVVPYKKTDPLHSIASLPTAIPGKYYCANEQDTAGACVDFFCRTVTPHITENPFAHMDAMAIQSPPGANGVIFLPWLNGERTPVDDPNLRAGFINLSKTTLATDMARAVLEGVATNIRWSLAFVELFAGRKLTPIHFVGGGSKSALWSQILADVLDREIVQMEDGHMANARGAAFIAAVGTGALSFSDIPALARIQQRFTPRPENRKEYDRIYDAFLSFHRKNRGLFARLNGNGM